MITIKLEYKGHTFRLSKDATSIEAIQNEAKERFKNQRYQNGFHLYLDNVEITSYNEIEEYCQKLGKNSAKLKIIPRQAQISQSIGDDTIQIMLEGINDPKQEEKVENEVKSEPIPENAFKKQEHVHDVVIQNKQVAEHQAAAAPQSHDQTQIKPILQEQEFNPPADSKAQSQIIKDIIEEGVKQAKEVKDDVKLQVQNAEKQVRNGKYVFNPKELDSPNEKEPQLSQNKDIIASQISKKQEEQQQDSGVRKGKVFNFKSIDESQSEKKEESYEYDFKKLSSHLSESEEEESQIKKPSKIIIDGYPCYKCLGVGLSKRNGDMSICQTCAGEGCFAQGSPLVKFINDICTKRIEQILSKYDLTLKKDKQAVQLPSKPTYAFNAFQIEHLPQTSVLGEALYWKITIQNTGTLEWKYLELRDCEDGQPIKLLRNQPNEKIDIRIGPVMFKKVGMASKNYQLFRKGDRGELIPVLDPFGFTIEIVPKPIKTSQIKYEQVQKSVLAPKPVIPPIVQVTTASEKAFQARILKLLPQIKATKPPVYYIGKLREIEITYREGSGFDNDTLIDIMRSM